MKTHFVVLEFTPEHEGDVNGIPWVDLLAGGVKVNNWQYVTAPTSQEDAMIQGMNNCISQHDCKSDLLALKLIIDAAAADANIPNEIYVWERLADMTLASELLDEIESFANGYVERYTPLVTKQSILQKNFDTFFAEHFGLTGSKS